MRSTLVLLALLTLVAATSLSGQGGYAHGRRARPAGATANPEPYSGPPVTLRGTLNSLTNKEIVIEVEEKHSIALRRSKKTKFFYGAKEIKPSDIPIGASVMLDATRDADAKLEAMKVTVVRFPPSPPPKRLRTRPEPSKALK